MKHCPSKRHAESVKESGEEVTESEVDDKKEIALRHPAMQVSVSLVRRRGSTRRLSTGCIRRSVSVVCGRGVVGYRGNMYLCTPGG